MAINAVNSRAAERIRNADLKERYVHRCIRCGKSEPEIKLTVDHVIPITKKGSNDIGNIQPLCYSCNASKQNRIMDYRLRFISESG